MWGANDATLPWLTPPPAASLATARALLVDLGALDPSGAITPHGRAMARLGQHPRLAHLVLKGRELGQGRVAALLAAILSERDFLRLPPGQRDVDLRHRVDIALSGKRDGALRLIQEQARRLMPRGAGDERPDVSMTGALLALAYPDRIGRRRPGTNRYLLSGGRGAALPDGDPMANEEFLVVADLDGSAQDSRIFLAAPISAGTRSKSCSPSRSSTRRRCSGASAKASCWRAAGGAWARCCSRTSRWRTPMPTSSRRR